MAERSSGGVTLDWRHAAILAAVVALLGTGFWWRGQAEWRPAVAVATLLAAAIVAVLCIGKSLRRQRLFDEKRAWRVLACAAVVIGLYAAATLGFRLAHRPAPWVELLPAAALLCLWAGLLLRPARFTGGAVAWLTLAWDGVLILGQLWLLLRAYGISALLISSKLAPGILAGRWAALVAVVGSLLVLHLLLTQGVPHFRRQHRLALAGALALVIAGLLALAGDVLHLPLPAWPAHLLWAFALLIVGVVAMAEWPSRGGETPADRVVDDCPPALDLLAPLVLLLPTALLSLRPLWQPGASAPALAEAATALAWLLGFWAGRAVLLGIRHRAFVRRMRAHYAELEHLVVTDTMTGLANQRLFRQRLEEELARATRYNRPFALLFSDVDFFKMVNDVHGHRAGDEVLCTVANTLRTSVRGTDLVARYGGEEFVLILPETTLTQACALAERLRATIEGLTIALPNGARLSVTISFGASAYPETSETGESLIVDADAAMNRAKEMGRNRVCKATATATLLLVE